MSGDSVEDQFKRFLADNKIDVSALSGTKEEARFYKDVEEQRALGIVKAVSSTVSLPKMKLQYLSLRSKNRVIDLISVFIEIGQLSLQQLRLVPSKVRHRWLHHRVSSRELLRSLCHQEPRASFPLSSRRYLLEKLCDKILRVLSNPPQQSLDGRLSSLRETAYSRIG